jgi:colicin import membrane protein
MIWSTPTLGTRSPEECRALADRQKAGEDLGYTDAFVRAWATPGGADKTAAARIEAEKAAAAKAAADKAAADKAEAAAKAEADKKAAADKAAADKAEAAAKADAKA